MDRGGGHRDVRPGFRLLRIQAGHLLDNPGRALARVQGEQPEPLPDNRLQGLRTMDEV